MTELDLVSSLRGDAWTKAVEVARSEGRPEFVSLDSAVFMKCLFNFILYGNIFADGPPPLRVTPVIVRLTKFKLLRRGLEIHPNIVEKHSLKSYMIPYHF